MRSKAIGWVAAAAAACLAGCGTPAGTSKPPATQTSKVQAPLDKQYSGPVVATYQGGKLTKQEFEQQYNLLVVLPNFQPRPTKAEFLKEYVILYKYAYGQAVKAVKSKVDTSQASAMTEQFIQQVAASQGKTVQQVEQRMKQLGLSRQDVRQILVKQQYVNVYLQDLMQDSPAASAVERKFYDAHRQDFCEVTVEHILVNNLALAKQIAAQLKAGADFAKLADKYSQDPGVKQNHGKYANALAIDFVPNFRNACETLPLGKISDPVHTQFGYHVMRVDERRQLSFTEAKRYMSQDDVLKQQLQPEISQAIYRQLVDAAHVQIVKGAKL